ncbi:MAG: NifU family protein [Actinomycetota bacterium]|nr:NifU family protein [Actinomycetota bacterium]
MDKVISVTPSAAKFVAEVAAGEEDASEIALWIEVSGTNGNAFTYDVYFQSKFDAEIADYVASEDGITVVVPKASIDQLSGSTLDLPEADGGLVITNPNTPSSMSEAPAGLEDATLDSAIARTIIELLQDEINPAIASHGGRADLVGVTDDKAFVRLSGGCQGCGLAAVTLSQGIEVAIKEAVPSITKVVDVTDHLSGTNPFYQASKK